MAHLQQQQQQQQQARWCQELQSLSAALTCLFVVYSVLPRLPQGLPRLLCVLPCFPILAWVPFSTRLHSLRSSVSFMFLWVCPSKLLLRCWGIHSDYPGHGFLYFIATTVMPFRVKGRRTHPLAEGPKPRPALTFQGALLPPFLQFFCFFATVNICRYAGSNSGWVRHALYCVLVYLGLEVVIGLSSKLTGLLLRVELHPFFDKPFLASSLSEFWGRRWNRLASYLLRETVYMPMLYLLTAGRQEHETKLHFSTWNTSRRSPQTHPLQNPDMATSLSAYRNDGTDAKRSDNGSPDKAERNSAICDKKSIVDAKKPPLFARALALFTSFVASGLIHEFMFYCMNQMHPTWEVTMFFTLQGVATVLEVYLRRKFPIFTDFPRPIAIFCTLTFLFFSAAWLFMPPIIQSGVDLRILAEFRQLQSAIVNLLNRRV